MSLSQLFPAFGSHTYWFLPDISSPPHSIAFANFIDLKKSSFCFLLAFKGGRGIDVFPSHPFPAVDDIFNKEPFSFWLFLFCIAHVPLEYFGTDPSQCSQHNLCEQRHARHTETLSHGRTSSTNSMFKKMQGVNTQLSIFIPIMKTLGDSCMCEYLQ